VPYANGLNKKKKRKIDDILTQKMGLIAASQDSYEGEIESAAVQLAQQIAERLLVQISQHGMLIFHCEAPVGYRQPDNSIVVPPSGQGGVSPSASAQWSGRGSIHLVFLPEVPSVAPTAKYRTPVTAVIRHEAGHNLFLCHAPATHGLTVAPGASRFVHDAADLFCLMNYDQTSDHLCGYCHIKLRGWATVASGDYDNKSVSPGHGTVKLWPTSGRNRV